MSFAELVWRALMERRRTVALSVLATGLSAMLLLVVLGLRREAEHRFEQVRRAPPLVVGASTSPTSLVLATVFFMGQRVGLLPQALLDELRAHRSTRLAIPLALGDSFRGHPVVATTPDVFAPDAGLAKGFGQGRAFAAGSVEAVVGAELSRTLDLRVDDRIEPAHGLEEASDGHGGEHLFRIVGVLAPTGGPIDRLVLVPLDAFRHLPGHGESDAVSAIALVPKAGMHRAILAAELRKRPDLVVAETAVEVAQLQRQLGAVDGVLLVVASLALLVAWLGLVASIWAVSRARLRELALLRFIGAGRTFVAGLVVAEGALIGAMGSLLGLALTLGAIAGGAPLLRAQTGIALPLTVSLDQVAALAAITIAGALAGLMPATEIYRRDLLGALRRSA